MTTIFTKCKSAVDLTLPLLNPIRDGGVQQPPYRKSALKPSKWHPNDPKFRDFSYFYMNYLKIKNFGGGFHSDFWCLEGGGVE